MILIKGGDNKDIPGPNPWADLGPPSGRIENDSPVLSIRHGDVCILWLAKQVRQEAVFVRIHLVERLKGGTVLIHRGIEDYKSAAGIVEINFIWRNPQIYVHCGSICMLNSSSARAREYCYYEPQTRPEVYYCHPPPQTLPQETLRKTTSAAGGGGGYYNPNITSSATNSNTGITFGAFTVL